MLADDAGKYSPPLHPAASDSDVHSRCRQQESSRTRSSSTAHYQSTHSSTHPHTHPYTHTPNNVDLYTIVDKEGALSEIPGGRLRPRRSVQGRASGLHHRWQQRNIHARSLAHDCEPPSDTQAIELLGSWSIIPQSWYWSAQARSHDATPFREIDVERQACSGQPGSPSHY